MARPAHASRLEGFSDAVFAFALTLLVVSLEVPRSYDELVSALHNFVAFALTFAVLVWIWYQHHEFFRRNDLSDGVMVALNSTLLFVVLLYVYPLKFLSQFLVDELLGATPTARIEPTQTANLVIIYSAGYVGVFIAFLLMHLYAWRKRALLELTPLEEHDARYATEACVINIAIGLLSIAVAAIGGPPAAAAAGFVYFLLAPARAIHGARTGRRRRALERVKSARVR